MKTQQKPNKCRVGLSWVMVAAFIAVAPAVRGTKPSPGPPETHYTGSATLSPTLTTGDEINASGAAKLTATVMAVLPGGGTIEGDLSLTCVGLAANAQYIVVGVGSPISGVATKQGTLKLSSAFRTGSKTGSVSLPTSISVYRVEPTGNILVLSGTITWQQVNNVPSSSITQAVDASADANTAQPFKATYVATTLVEHERYQYVWSGTGSGAVVGPSSELAYVHIVGKKALCQGTFTAQNGDELDIEATQTWEASTQSWVGTFTVVGGTGRFAAAMGGGTATATPNPDGSRNNILNGALNF